MDNLTGLPGVDYIKVPGIKGVTSLLKKEAGLYGNNNLTAYLAATLDHPNPMNPSPLQTKHTRGAPKYAPKKSRLIPNITERPQSKNRILKPTFEDHISRPSVFRAKSFRHRMECFGGTDSLPLAYLSIHGTGTLNKEAAFSGVMSMAFIQSLKSVLLKGSIIFR